MVKCENAPWLTCHALPNETIEGLKILLKGGQAVKSIFDAFEIIRTRPHGQVAAVLGTLRKIGLEKIISASSRGERDLVLAMIVARIIDPSSKLATCRGLNPETCTSTLGELRFKGAANIGLRVGKILNRFKMAKHFHLEITEEAETLKKLLVQQKDKRCFERVQVLYFLKIRQVETVGHLAVIIGRGRRTIT